jgi:acyl-CoA reductase-like NAD-dependent aldehyde dehydrogenase
MRAIPMLIDGAWVEPERTYDVVDPYRKEPVWRAPNSRRVDQLPYGGIEDSSIGSEGPRYAIRKMTDERLIVFNM